MQNKLTNGTIFFVLVITCVLAIPAAAQEGYQEPAEAITALVDAAPTPLVTVTPDNQWMLFLELPSLPSIEELSQPELRLAGLRINPRTNGRSRSRYYTGLASQAILSGERRRIKGLPDGGRIGSINFSPDSAWVSFTVTRSERIELWAAKLSDGKALRLFDQPLVAIDRSPCRWLSDSRSLVCAAVPAGRGAPPQETTVPEGPVTQENIGRKAPARTYQDLLKSPHDEKVYEYYATSQIVQVTVDGDVKELGEPGIVRQLTTSPDGNHLLVAVTHRPYSYLVPASRFPYRVEVWNLDGKVVKKITDRPLADDVPVAFGSVATGPRSFSWRADAAATLTWAEAQDGGDAGKKADVRDKVFAWDAPFDGEPRELITLALRYSGIQWGTEDLALVHEFWWRTRRRRVWKIEPGNESDEPKKLFDLSTEDRYNDPGSPMMAPNDSGKYVLLTDQGGDTIYLRSSGASPEGDRPFIDEYILSRRESVRIWRSEGEQYEWPVDMLDLKSATALTSRESVDEPPNYFLRNLKSGKLRQLTNFEHPTPQLRGVYKELIKYKRDDGVELSGTLYLPPGKAPADGPFPVLMWAYPREYKNAAAAGQVRRSPYRFTRISPTSSLIYLAAGYAVFDDPIMPIVGEGDDEPNDTYVKQLVASAQAAIDTLVDRGVADRKRVAIAGHSYGAFMVANLLAHSDLFAAGVARSGAYNRTLTPFGFQAEQRTYWQAPEIYYNMSPFMHADKVNEPILMIHGQADNNSGTFPIQSERFYHALKGHGATARLVMLPHESHGYRARASVLHMLWETLEWLDKYVAHPN